MWCKLLLLWPSKIFKNTKKCQWIFKKKLGRFEQSILFFYPNLLDLERKFLNFTKLIIFRCFSKHGRCNASKYEWHQDGDELPQLRAVEPGQIFYQFILVLPCFYFSTLELTPGIWYSLNIYYYYFWCLRLKGTVSVISSDPPCKDSNARFTTVPFKPLTVHV